MIPGTTSIYGMSDIVPSADDSASRNPFSPEHGTPCMQRSLSRSYADHQTGSTELSCSKRERRGREVRPGRKRWMSMYFSQQPLPASKFKSQNSVFTIYDHGWFYIFNYWRSFSALHTSLRRAHSNIISLHRYPRSGVCFFVHLRVFVGSQMAGSSFCASESKKQPCVVARYPDGQTGSCLL